MTGRLEGKVALVSAAANGIGRAVARRFAAEGAVLSLFDVADDALGAVGDELRATGATVEVTVGDATDRAVVDDWIARAVAQHGRVDVLSNNVGVSRTGRIGDLTDEDWHFQQRLTLDTVFYATRAVLAPMVDAGRGAIVSMSSGAGIGGQYALGGYAAAKAGVINLMETVALEYGPYGIRANAVTPGPTATAPLRRVPGAAAGRSRRARARSRPPSSQRAGRGGQHRAVARVRRGVERHRHLRALQHPLRQPPPHLIGQI